jgi:hypothetical protein
MIASIRATDRSPYPPRLAFSKVPGWYCWVFPVAYMITDLEDSVLALLLRKIAPGKLGHPLLGWRKRTGQPDRRASFDSSRTPEGLLPLKKKASDLRVLILFDGDKEGSPTPETSG